MINIDKFEVLSRPGYFGSKRHEKMVELSKLHGVGKWREVWQVNGLVYSFDEAVMLYDDAYYHYISNLPREKLDWILSFAECYDNDVSNINCGTMHNKFVAPRHLQDVSVRRALLRMGVYFRGEKPYTENNLLEIRGKDTNGYELMPGNISFHKPELILPAENIENFPKWAKPNSIEAFWQCNKIIVRN